MDTKELNTMRDSILAEIKKMMLAQGQVTQYIGARYVPLFANPIEWDDQREYEPLTVVQYQGDSYTSRQFVPKGIRIADAHYWALTGNYNAQIEQYRQEMKTFDERIENNSTAIQAEANRAAAAEATKAPINHASSEKTYGVGTLTDYGHLKLGNKGTPDDSDENSGIAVTPKMLSRNTICVLGDSFSQINGRNMWPDLLTEFTIRNYAKAGASFTNTSNTIDEQIDKLINETTNKRDIRDIIVYAGYNDFQIKSSYQSIISAIDDCYARLAEFKGEHPINIHMCLFNCSFAGNTINTENWQQWNNIFDNVLPAINCPYILAFSWLYGFKKSDFNDEGVHPGDTLNKHIANIMRDIIFGNYNPEKINVCENFTANGYVCHIETRCGHIKPIFGGGINVSGSAGSQSIIKISPTYFQDANQLWAPNLNYMGVPWACSTEGVYNVIFDPSKNELKANLNKNIDSVTTVYL